MRGIIQKYVPVCFVLTGSLLSAVAINTYLIPHKMLSGGVAGLSIMLEYLFGVPTGLVLFILNVPIFVLGYRHIDRNFIIASLAGMSSLSLFLILTAGRTSWLAVDDTMLAAVYGGVLNGLGMGVVFKNRGSLGGTDILAVIARKYLSLNIGTVLLGANIVVVSLGSIFFGIKPAMFTLIGMTVSAYILDQVQMGFDRKKSIIIISDHSEAIADAIITQVQRGVTFLHGEGAFTHQGKRVIYCAVTITQVAKVKFIIERIDKNAFMIVHDAAEVLGKGFKKELHL